MMHRPVRKSIGTFFAAVFALAVLAAGGAHAQTLFQLLTAPGTKSVTLPAGNTPAGVAVADFNHDGYPDLVVANKGANTMSVYLSTGPGTFAAPATYPTCGGPTAVIAEDLDLTGLNDIVLTCDSPTSNAIQIFLNLGNGTFNPVVDNQTNIVLGTGLAPVAIVSGDFNHDGHPDLAVADHGDGTVTVFLSDASSNFTSFKTVTLDGLGSPTGIAAGYFNTTGNLSLAVTDSSANVVHILLGDGTGDFADISDSNTGTGPAAVTAADFNHDGNTDLAVVNATDGTVSILLGKGNGSFKRATSITIGPGSGTGANSILALDITSNGYPDLIVGNTLQNQLAVLMNDAGTFQTPQYYSVPNGPAYLATGDFNRDGKPDLAVTQSSGNSVSVLINNTLATSAPGGRNFATPVLMKNGNGNMADAIAVADFNHDGVPDVATAYLEDNTVKVQLTTGKGKNFKSTVATYAVGQQPYALVAADLNQDGYPDLIAMNNAVNEPSGTLSILMNKGDGSGTFNPAITIDNIGRLPYGLAVGDLNGDGIPDIVVADYGDNSLTVLYGPFNGPAQTVQSIPTCTNPYGVAIGDFRHTGQNDIAVTCYGSNQMEVFLNNGMIPFQPPQLPTTFQAGVMYSTDVRPTSIVLSDFNRDGNLDIVTGNSTANDVSFFAGHGDGSFSAAVNSVAYNFPVSLAVGDLNGDGIPDLAAVAPNNNTVTFMQGKGDGTFLPYLNFAAGTQPWAVALADFNHDGKLDFVTANTYNRVNITVPAYINMYMTEFPPVAGGHPSVYGAFNASGTNIALSISPSSTVTSGTSVTFTATVSPAIGTTTPTGSVIFQDSDGLSSAPVTLNNGSASYTTSILGTGAHQITVLYSGDATYQPNTVTDPSFTVTVTGTPVVLSIPTIVTNPSVPTSYSVTVGTPVANAPNPVGTITLYGILPNGTTVTADGPHPIGTAGLGGVSDFTGTLPAGVPAGTYQIYAVFQPAAGSTYTRGSSPVTQVVVQ